MTKKQERAIYAWQLRTLWRHRKQLVVTGHMWAGLAATVTIAVLPVFVNVPSSFPLGLILAMLMAAMTLGVCAALFLRFKIADDDESDQATGEPNQATK